MNFFIDDLIGIGSKNYGMLETNFIYAIVFQFGDGGDGGGVVLRGIKWGENAFSIANDVLKLYFDAEDIKIFAFKVSPKGYIYIRLDKVSQK